MNPAHGLTVRTGTMLDDGTYSSVGGILDKIAGPEDLRRLSIIELRRLAAEIRNRIIATVSQTGGHLAPSLGVVELTLALHYVFDTPEDRVVWDVGHQCYAHKLITGRQQQFSLLRTSAGLSGFPKRAESPYDVFDAGHAGDAISVALGMAIADNLCGAKRRTVAVIGDGSIVTGIAFEALNNAGGIQANLIVVLNDNEMSIARSNGAFAHYLNRIITGRLYNRLRADVWNLLGRLPSNLSGRARLAARKLEEGLKNLIAPSIIFEELGFRYFGPFDGHNLITLIDTFRKVRDLNQPIIVHVVTRKGRGYPPAEREPELFHGIGRFDIATGKPEPVESGFTHAFGDELVRLAEQDDRIVAITAGMTLGTGLAEFRKRFPKRFFDVGIAEQHAVGLAAGLSLAGLRPVVAIYSTFLARAYDQIIQDIGLQNLPVVFAIDRAGLVGEDGPTHHGNLDFSYLRCIPGITIAAPADETELRMMLRFALQPRTSPIAIRYPRGKSSGTLSAVPPIAEGRGVVLHTPTGDIQPRIALLAVGTAVLPALTAARILEQEGISTLVANMRFIKPIDERLIADAVRCPLIMTLEENTIVGGLGSAVLERIPDTKARVVRLALPDAWVPHGKRSEQLTLVGLNPETIVERVRKELGG